MNDKLGYALIGRRFGKLAVVDQVELPTKSYRGKRWLCRCECGTEEERFTRQLFNVPLPECHMCFLAGKARERSRRHGESKSLLYFVWRNMRGRCESPAASSWKYYGARGIRVCEEWELYETFRQWALSHGYGPDLTIERIDPRGNYEPSNCEWITASENSRRRLAYYRQTA